MMIAVKLALAYVAIWLLGALALAHIGARGRGILGVVADFAAGVVLLAFVGSIAVIGGIRLSPLAIYGLVLVLGAAATIRRRGVRVSLELPEDRIARLLLVAIVLPIGLLALSALDDRLWWDGWAIWVLKARILFNEGTLPSEYFERGGWLAFSHTDYPLAVPLLNWWLFHHVGAPDPAVAALAGTIWHAVLVFTVVGVLRDRVGDRVAALTGLGIACFWPIAFFASGGTADVVIALALVGALWEMDEGLASGDASAFWRSGVFLALGAMAKTEGLAVAVAVGGAAALLAWRRTLRPRRLLGCALPFAIVAPWLVFTKALGIRRPYFTLDLTAAELLDRAVLFAKSVGTMVFGSASWLPLAGIIGVGILRDRSHAGWLALGGYFTAIAMTYLLTPDDPLWLIDTSLRRVLAACVPAALYVSLGGAAAPFSPAPAPTAVNSDRALDRDELSGQGRTDDLEGSGKEIGVVGHARAT